MVYIDNQRHIPTHGTVLRIVCYTDNHHATMQLYPTMIDCSWNVKPAC